MYPGFLQASLWFVALSLFTVFQDMFIPVSGDVFVLLVAGVVFFGMGAFLGSYDHTPQRTRNYVAEGTLPSGPAVVVLAVALHEVDHSAAEAFCCELAVHPHEAVRGNAILGLGHIARIHRKLDLATAVPLVRRGLTDAHSYVRGQAHSAADDVEMFLKVSAR